MKITFDWLKDHLSVSDKEQKLLEKLTDIGLEVESVENLSEGLHLFKVAKILKTEKHPNADRLKVCDVDVGEKEIKKVNDFLRSQGEAEYFDEILSFGDQKKSEDLNKVDEKDELYHTAVEIIRTEGKASTSFLQRKLQIGYNRAARIIDAMEADGIVSKANHVGKREGIK